MQKRIKFVCVAAVLALALAGCGGSASSSAGSEGAAASSEAATSTVLASTSPEEQNSTGEASLDLDGAFDELLAANPISNQFEIAAMNIEYDFGLAPEDVVAYKGVKSNDNGDAGLVLVLEVPAGKASSVCDTLSTYLQDQAAFYGNYAEFTEAQANVAAASVVSREGSGNSVVILVIASNESDGSALTAAKDSALDIAMG